jgi:hypothetical protein
MYLCLVSSVISETTVRDDKRQVLADNALPDRDVQEGAAWQHGQSADAEEGSVEAVHVDDAALLVNLQLAVVDNNHGRMIPPQP